MNYISQEELEAVMLDRDRGMYRIHVATELRKRQLQAKNVEEYYSIPIPRIFSISSGIFEEYKENREMHWQIDGFIDAYCRGLNQLDDLGNNVCRYGNLGSVVLSDLFRGENRIYNSECTSSLGRICRGLNNNSFKDQIIEFTIAQMRMYIFYGFLTQFRQYREFPFGTAFPHLIAQHYGLPTQFLDLTDDIKVALFFACCRYNEKEHKYFPIQKEDFDTYGEYAVLYHGIEDEENSRMIGYQPFTRCFKQRGYCIDTAQNIPCWEYSLIKNSNYTKSYFKRTPELCRRIYEEFEEGQELFPKDSLFEFENVIEQIKTAKQFPTIVFDIIVECVKSYVSCYHQFVLDKSFSLKDWLYNGLMNSEISFNDKFVALIDMDKFQYYNDAWNIAKYKEKNDIIAWGREVIPLDNGNFRISLPIKNIGIYTDSEEEFPTYKEMKEWIELKNKI